MDRGHTQPALTQPVPLGDEFGKCCVPTTYHLLRKEKGSELLSGTGRGSLGWWSLRWGLGRQDPGAAQCLPLHNKPTRKAAMIHVLPPVSFISGSFTDAESTRNSPLTKTIALKSLSGAGAAGTGGSDITGGLTRLLMSPETGKPASLSLRRIGCSASLSCTRICWKSVLIRVGVAESGGAPGPITWFGRGVVRLPGEMGWGFGAAGQWDPHVPGAFVLRFSS